MPSADFAAAQERLAARRAQRAQRNPNLHHNASSSSTNPTPPSRLPYPLNSLSRASFSAWDAIKGREGTRPAFRVGQVDAELLDEELLELLKSQVSEGLKHFGSHISESYSAEILLALRLVLFKLSIWNNNASYGAHLQGLRYTDARSTRPDRPPPKPWQKVLYGAITVGGRYVWAKWEDYLLSASEDYTVPQSNTLRLFSRVTEQINSLHDFASLASFLVFLVNGRYRTLTDRVLRLRLAPTSHSTSREVSFEYLNRQLVWHAFTEFLLFLLPLVGISRWRRILSRSLRKLRAEFLRLIGRSPAGGSSSGDEDEGDGLRKEGELAFLPERTCAICYRDQNPTSATEADVLAQSAGGGGVVGSAATDITNPYEAIPCGCMYCFACLAQRIANEEGEGWTCLRCGELIKECRPWSGDILEEKKSSRTQSGSSGYHAAKTVGFATIGGDDDEEGDEKAGLLRQVDPMPDEQEEISAASLAVEGEGLIGIDGSRRSLDLAALSESNEWARASEDQSSSDEQSEEYDEDEEEEGEELEYDM